MTRLLPSAVVAALVLAGISTTGLAADVPAPQAGAAEKEQFFEKHIRPILANHCFECHGATKQEGGLRLDGIELLKKGNESGPAVVPGDPEQSRLVRVIRYPDDDYQMPPKGKLPQAQIDLLTAWVKIGAPWPAADVPQAAADPEAWKQHWAFLPIGRPEPPAVKTTARVQTPVDNFVLAQLEENGLSLSPQADKRTLIRRVTYDLVGLPPTHEEIVAFEKDDSPQAFARLVDRLLDSPHYGERWGRHWLDVARYADTKGYVFREDRNYPFAYMYRDWVIQAFNDDLPYDRFLMLQLAADKLVPADDAKSLAAMGFLTLGRRFLNNIHDITDDRIDVVTRGTMGLTVACARCHDHKYDPIPTADYYSLYGIFVSSEEPKDEPQPLRMVDKEKPHNVHVFLRGQAGNRGPIAPRQFLMCLSDEDRQPYTEGSGRLQLAQEIASAQNPLTARVLVNRVWMYHFGAGLVSTPSDFGTRSDPPSHPELLDYLAGRFIDEGWSIKKLHRWILLSSTWQQQSNDRPECRAVDPENLLLWRMNRQRLDFEAHRDSLLAVTGRLDRTRGGKSVELTSEPFTLRRTVYGFIDRQNLPGLFRTFDFASPDTHNPQRYVTTVPQQALFLMNSPFVMQQAAAVAGRPEVTAESDAVARIRQLYRLVLGRPPTADEVAMGIRFIQSPPAESAVLATAPLWQYGYGAFDEASRQLRSFQPLPHWTGKTWQGGPATPDPKLGWCILSARGGHPGNNVEHAVIRRWTAPRAMTLKINGRLKHPSDQGDGVRGRILSSRTGLLGEWTAQKGETGTNLGNVEVQPGETIDFITDCRTNPNHDGFEWTVSLRTENMPEAGPREWRSSEGFGGPPPEPLDAWARYAQVLLLSNEFTFVD